MMLLIPSYPLLVISFHPLLLFLFLHVPFFSFFSCLFPIYFLEKKSIHCDTVHGHTMRESLIVIPCVESNQIFLLPPLLFLFRIYTYPSPSLNFRNAHLPSSKFKTQQFMRWKMSSACPDQHSCFANQPKKKREFRKIKSFKEDFWLPSCTTTTMTTTTSTFELHVENCHRSATKKEV